MKINEGQVFALGTLVGIGGLIFLGCKAAKVENNRIKMLNEKKRFYLNGMEDDIEDASITNVYLTVDERVATYKMLTHYRKKISNASNMEDLISAVDHFDDIFSLALSAHVDNNKEALLTYIKLYDERCSELREQNKLEKELDAARENVEIMADAVRSLKQEESDNEE